MKKTFLLFSLFSLLFSFGLTFGYSSEDLSNANSLADQSIIVKQTVASKYNLDSNILRQEVIGMALKIKGITLPENYKCKKYFADATQNNWECRAVELAADNGIITRSNKYANPGKLVTRAEGLAMVMNAGGRITNEYLPGHDYFFDANLYYEGSIGYKDKYNFGAQWQARIFYDYFLDIVVDRLSLTTDPRANEYATRAEVFDFAKNLFYKGNKIGGLGDAAVCGTFSKDFTSSPSDGIDARMVQDLKNEFCKKGEISHLYENNTGIAWSCDGTINRICSTDKFNYGTSQLRVNSISGINLKGSSVALLTNLSTNGNVKIQAGNYHRFGTMLDIKDYDITRNGEIQFLLPDNLNGAMGDFTGHEHISSEPYGIYINNTKSGEYVRLYNPFGTGHFFNV